TIAQRTHASENGGISPALARARIMLVTCATATAMKPTIASSAVARWPASAVLSVTATPGWTRHLVSSASCYGRSRLVPSRGRLALFFDQRLGERKLQHDVAVLVGDHDRGGEQLRVVAFFLKQFEDHRLGDLPGVVGVAQHLAFGVRDGLIIDQGV